MQSENPYKELILDSSSYNKVIPNPQNEQVKHAQYWQQNQIQQPQSQQQQQQPIISNTKINLVPQVHLVPPQIDMINQPNDQNLLQHQTTQQKKMFVMKVALIGLIQEILMFFASFVDSRNLIKIFYNNKVVQWPFYLVNLAVITLTISSRFLKPRKEVRNPQYFKHYFQGVIQVCMTILYIFQASSISIILGRNFVYYSAMLFCHAATLLSMVITQAIKCRDEQPVLKYIIVQISVVCIPTIYLLQKDGTQYTTFLEAIILILLFVVLGWSLGFGLIFLYSIEQLLKGKYQLNKSDSVAAATIVYGNMVTPTC